MSIAIVFKRRQYLVRSANQQTRECTSNGAIDRHVALAWTGRGRAGIHIVTRPGHAGPLGSNTGPFQGLSRYKNRISPLLPPYAHSKKKLFKGYDEIWRRFRPSTMIFRYIKLWIL